MKSHKSALIKSVVDYRGRSGRTPLLDRLRHVNPYGSFELDMAKRLPLDQPLVAVQ